VIVAFFNLPQHRRPFLLDHALVPSRRIVTDLQKEIIEQYLSNGGKGTEAVKAAGYKGKNAGSRFSQEIAKPHVREYLRTRALELVNTKMLAKSLARLDKMLESKSDDITLRAIKEVIALAGIQEKNKSGSVLQGDVNILVDMTRPSERKAGTPLVDGTHPQEVLS
jgi:phage terminase small subunit